MWVNVFVTLGIVSAAVAGGCGKNPAPPPVASPPSDVVEAQTERAAKEPDEPEIAAEAAAPQAPPPTPLEIVPTNASAAAAEPQADDAQYRERIALLTPGGPLVIDVWLTLEGRPHKELFAARIKQVLDAAASTAVGRPTWADLATNEKFLQAERGANPGTARSRAKTWTEGFDLNRDQQIQPAEAAAWLGRDAGRSLAALALRGRRSYRALPALSSRVWQLLDADANGRLDAGEVGAAPDRLLSLDANDDCILVPPELAKLRDQLGDAAMPRIDSGGSPSYHAALHLESRADIERLDYVFGDLYAPRQDLAPTSFPELPRLFSQLDANGDRRLESQELAGLATTEPHLAVLITFDQPASDQPAQANVQIRQHAQELTVVAQPAANRAVVALGSTRITLSAHDFGVPNAPDPPGERSEIRAMIHDEGDALFDEFDRNADGRLGEREIAASPARMLARDRNQDGQLSSDELPSTMIVAFLRSERPAEQSFYQPEFVATLEQAAGAPAWFTAADFNGDGDVSRREFLGPIEQFAKLDADQNGFIAAEEAGSTPAK